MDVEAFVLGLAAGAVLPLLAMRHLLGVCEELAIMLDACMRGAGSGGASRGQD